ncbi:MetQ/NlpA family ABC transporter substrate-binding protein [Paenibacillus sacheonensis]|uniref:Lipoprotein n=1 Tax=Paenibacillus sacheonensis TaxID=742054 RepID=A0A7X4YVG9_9BACL|nr:MetQ/NlpA family ABC transporter substrate-binding protein [Paenibacillus sacheonensis]MBM7565718.1 D-methionine transport system substrate-binding protein [Paenibacillus sacheonensis]NBC72224.1 MetQ/NlpA family lipoprotein [Paenibacillus sacheonensis]
MRKGTLALVVFVLIAVLTACGAKKDNENNTAGNDAAGAGSNAGTQEITLKVGASPVPHAEILNFIKPALKEKGINLEVVEFNDYVQPNTQLHEKQLDANFFQHTPYLDQFNKDKGYDLVSVAGVHIEPFGAYSKKVKSTDELKEGAKVVIPNDPSNGGRALALMAANGLIKLKDGVGVAGTVHDITENPKKLKITEVEAATLPRVLDEVDLALINTNYALEAGLVPTKDALFIEGSDSPYVNILVARPDNKDSAGIQALAAALQTPEVKKFIEDKYKGAIVPAFK